MTFAEKFNIQQKKNIVVLLAPLDWGLGHASRCIPIIRYLKSINCEVIIAGDGIQQHLLKVEFPDLSFVNLQGYGVTFSKNRVKTLIKILLQVPKILISINKEYRWLKQFLRVRKVDLIISDNRYGFYSKTVSSVFITHQLTIKTPFGRHIENVLREMNYRYIERFTECWVPDFEGPVNFGGTLSHPTENPLIPVKFLGRLSRIEEEKSLSCKLHLLLILSGPEPQRTIFETKLLSQLQDYNKSVVLLRGLPGTNKTLSSTSKNLTIYNHLTASEISKLVSEASFVISRSGYSTVMDLIGLSKKCIFIPTPGQYEQEYLAEYLSSLNLCLRYNQDDFELTKAIENAESYQFAPFKRPAKDQFKTVIDEFIDNLSTNEP